jgi:polysaccharide biosynthesis transport protein
MQAHDMTMADYAGILRRRWRPALLAGMAVAFASVYVAFNLPAVYESTATILIEQQEVPEEFVQSTINSYTDERLQSIRQRVMAAPRVAEIISKFDLYREERASLAEEELVELFRTNSDMRPLNVTATHARTGRLTDITYAFEVAFRSSDPVLARDITAELSRAWIAENEALRGETKARTARFLDTEVERVEERLAELQARIADFKEGFADSLPDARLINLQAQDRMARELTEVENQLRATRERKALLESELAETPRFRPVVSDSGEPVIGGADRLAMLQQELIVARGRYSENHPDVIRLRREIAALSDEPGSQASLAEQLRSSLEANRGELANARESFSPDHPDVLRLQRTVAAIEQQLAEAERASGGATRRAAQPNNPPYQQLVTRIATADAELQDLSRRRADLVGQLNDIERRVTQSPQVEREYSALVRENESLMAEYRELRTKQTQAGLAETLETGDKGERLSLIEPPFVPTSPIQPNRASLSFLGILVAIAVGLGMVSLRESMDNTVRGRRDVSTMLEMPPLATIPFIETRADTRKRLLGNMMIVAVAIIAVGTLYTQVVGT